MLNKKLYRPKIFIRGYTCDWYLESEILNMFPHAREIIPDKISEYEELKKSLEKENGKQINNVNNATTDEFTRWFCKKIIAMEHISTLLTYDRHIMRLKRQLANLNPQKIYDRYNDNFREKIEYAKSRRIEEVMGRFLEIKQVGNDWTCICPFHADKNPSMRIYGTGQNFHCFGCGEHGGTINFIIKIQGCSFGEAVKYLQN